MSERPTLSLDDAFARSARRGTMPAMGQRQIGLRAHLDQPRGGTLELGGLETVAPGVEPVRLSGR